VPQGRPQGGRGRKEEREKQKKQTFQCLHQQGEQEDHHTLPIEEIEWQGGGYQGEQASQQGVNQVYVGAKGDYFNHEWHQKGLDHEGEVRILVEFGQFGDLAKLRCISYGASSCSSHCQGC
jgi:hypothetical protein